MQNEISAIDTNHDLRNSKEMQDQHVAGNQGKWHGGGTLTESGRRAELMLEVCKCTVFREQEAVWRTWGFE